jgi:selenocysteine lyase/cysteine desulfurase
VTLTRRAWVLGAGAAPLQAGLASAALAAPTASAPVIAKPASLPAKADFAPMATTYLDSGTMHPFSLGARAAVGRYLDSRALDPSAAHFGLDDTEARACAKFARLINAAPEEVCLVPSTTAGEHLIIQALGLPASGGRVVTDTLHFFGSFYLYEALSQRGADVVWLKPRDGQRIDLADLDAAVDKTTRLVSVSLVSTTNGFQHDLEAVCEIAHARGALVYADIVHAAGAVPMDVKASGVDFAACATYKWLMGDFGLGFLYGRADRLDRIGHSQFGYYQLGGFQTHAFPFDPPGATVADCTPRPDVQGRFATGTTSGAGVAQVDYSLDYIQAIGVEAIQAHRLPLLAKARRELVRMGYQPMTPEESTSPLQAFAYPDAERLASRLARAKVKITLSRNRFRLSPSVFNDMDDIDRLLEALS